MPSEAALSRPARLENLTLWQRVYDHLREEILAGRLKPGAELAEVPLSEQLGVSRRPLALEGGVSRAVPGARGTRDDGCQARGATLEYGRLRDAAGPDRDDGEARRAGRGRRVLRGECRVPRAPLRG